MTAFLLFILGLSVGAFGTLIGVGGGFILVPIFLLVLNYTPQHTIGTSLAIVFLNAVSGTTAYIRQKKVYYDAGIKFALATIPGAFFGSYLAKYFSSRGFNITFGILLVFIAILMYQRTKQQQQDPKSFDPANFHYNQKVGILISFVVGFLSSILGIGGGIIHVPAMVYLLGFPTHVATATSHFVLSISSITGVISHFIIGNVLIGPALIIGFGAIIGAQLGAKLSQQVKSKPILMALAGTLLVIGLRLILR